MSPLADLLLKHLEVVDIATWDIPVLGWAVRKHTFCHRHAGWMACLVNLPALMRAMLPEWQARWHRSLARWSGDVSLLVGSFCHFLYSVPSRRLGFVLPKSAAR